MYKELKNRQKNLEKIERKMAQNREQMKEPEDKIKEIEAQEANLGSIIDEHTQELPHLLERQKDVKADISKIQQNMRDITNDEREISSAMEDHQKSSQMIGARIDAENQRIQNDTV